MTNSTLKNKKEFESDRCPTCKTLIENIKKLQPKVIYKCGQCDNNFFIEKVPKLFFT